MNLFLKNSRLKAVILILILFAFAKANSQQLSSKTTEIIATIDKSTTRGELIETLKKLSAEHQLETMLTAFKRNDNSIKQLGFIITGTNGKPINFETKEANGIASICIESNAQGTVSNVGFCSAASATIQNQTLAKGAHPDNYAPMKNVVENLDQNGTRQQQLQLLKEQAELRNQRRLENINIESNNQALQKVQVLESKQEEIVTNTQLMKEQQIEARSQLKKLEIDNNRKRRERKTLDYNNERALAKRDSLLNQQQRLIQKIEKEKEILEVALQAQKETSEIVMQQQQVIAEQGLKAETATGLKAYRTALLGNQDNDLLLKQGYLFFAAEQCSYRVYSGYTIVFDAMGKLMFTINEELDKNTVQGSLNIRGRSYDYIFSSNILMIRNNDGQQVDQYGDLLEKSILTNREIPFEITNEFVISPSMNPRELLALITDLESIGISLEIYSIRRDADSKIEKLRFSLQGKQYNYDGQPLVPKIVLEIDQPRGQARVMVLES